MIHVVVGPPASGKSTYVDEHAAENEVKVDFDRIAQAFGSGIPHGSVEPFRTVAFAARSAAIRRILDENIDAWIIHSRPSVEQVEAYERADAEFILVDPGIDQCLEQAADDDRPEGPEQAIRDWYDDPPNLPTGKNQHTQHKENRMMLTKTIRTPVKARTNEDGEPTGFTGYAAVFDNIDLGGDKIIKGAFAQTLASRYPDHGAGIPVYWNHDTDDPFKNLGLTTSAIEDEHGLKVEGDIDTGTELGKQVAKLLKENRVSQMSFAYNVEAGAWVDGQKNDDGTFTPGYYELRQLDLFEVSICPIGMNQATEVSAKKALLGLDPDQQPHDEPSTPSTPRLTDGIRRLRLLNIQ